MPTPLVGDERRSFSRCRPWFQERCGALPSVIEYKEFLASPIPANILAEFIFSEYVLPFLAAGVIFVKNRALRADTTFDF